MNERRSLEIIVTALKEHYDRKYKLYKANNEMPVTDKEFEELRAKALEVREIKQVLEEMQQQLADIIELEESEETEEDE